jgi:hypothetical protein
MQTNVGECEYLIHDLIVMQGSGQIVPLLLLLQGGDAQGK